MRVRFLQRGAEVMERPDPFAREKLDEFRDSVAGNGMEYTLTDLLQREAHIHTFPPLIYSLH